MTIFRPIGLVVLLGKQTPFALVDLGEEHIGIVGTGVQMGEAEAVGQGQGLGIDTSTSYNIYMCVGGQGGKGFLQRGEHFYARGIIVFLARQYDVATIGEGALGQRLKGATSHNDGMAGGEGFEALQVGTKMIEEVVIPTYGTIVGHGTNYG